MIASLTARTDFTPVPRVEVGIATVDEYDGGSGSGTGTGSLDGGTAGGTGSIADGGTASLVSVEIPEATERITVRASVDGLSYIVQGTVGRLYTGPFSVQDFHPQPDATTTYEIDCFDEAGTALTRLQLGSVYLPSSIGEDEVIVQHPLNPRLYAVVRNMVGSWPVIGRDAPGDASYAEGEEFPQFTGFGPLRGIDDFAVDFEAPTREVAARLWATLGTRENPQIPVWIIRGSNPGLRPRVFYGRIRRLNEIDVTVSHRGPSGGISRFQASLQQVKQPAPGLLAATLKYSDLGASFGTYSELAATLSTYSAWASAWEYAGAAG